MAVDLMFVLPSTFSNTHIKISLPEYLLPCSASVDAAQPAVAPVYLTPPEHRINGNPCLENNASMHKYATFEIKPKWPILQGILYFIVRKAIHTEL